MTADEEAALHAALAERRAKVQATLQALIPAPGDGGDGRVLAAMRYAALNGGKRLRAFLVMESAALFGVATDCAARAAASIEAMHAYSLAHDDLPAMDDDDLRRGEPATHIAFDEATAILAGDALQTLAFEILAQPATHDDPFVRCKLVAQLASASGAQGMVGGQMIDLAAETASTPLDLPQITRLQQLKTGALIRCACAFGAILGKASDDATRALDGYAHDLGLAFQIRDDLLDIEGTEAETGKKVGKDEAAGKATFVSILGVDQARDRASMLVDQAVRHLAPFDERAARLKMVAQYTVTRRV